VVSHQHAVDAPRSEQLTLFWCNQDSCCFLKLEQQHLIADSISTDSQRRGMDVCSKGTDGNQFIQAGVASL